MRAVKYSLYSVVLILIVGAVFIWLDRNLLAPPEPEDMVQPSGVSVPPFWTDQQMNRRA